VLARAELTPNQSIESRFQSLDLSSAYNPGALPQAFLEDALSALNRYGITDPGYSGAFGFS
jgi:hypothetical protein